MRRSQQNTVQSRQRSKQISAGVDVANRELCSTIGWRDAVDGAVKQNIKPHTHIAQSQSTTRVSVNRVR